MSANPKPFKDFKWMGFKSHMMATMAKWREAGHLTDTVFQCVRISRLKLTFCNFLYTFQVDGTVSAHKLILAAASPLLKEAMHQEPLEDQDLVIFLPEVSTSAMTSILDLIYKGRMTITPQSTWGIRSLVKELMINAEDVSVVNSGSKKPLTPVLRQVQPNPNVNVDEEQQRSSRKRKRNSIGDTPKAAKLAKPNTSTSKKGKKSKNKGNQQIEPVDSELEISGFHDFEDVETWVCAICQCYDPPVDPNNPLAVMTTEWIGCDCNRWYHQYCTGLKVIDDSFSCKQLGRECLPM